MAAKKQPPAEPLRGNFEIRDGVYSIRTRIDGRRLRFKLGEVGEMSEAKAREKGAAMLERMAREKRGFAPAVPTGVTVQQHFEAWVSGQLLQQYGPINGLKAKKSADVDGWRAKKYLKPIAAMPVVAVTEQDIDRVVAGIPADRSAATRKNVYAFLHRGFDLAIVPARLRKDNPVTRYHKPAKDPPKLFAYLYPSEVLALLACRAVPLGRRVLYAIAVYTGLRKGSIFALTWRAVDFAHRTLLSQVSKTGIAQLFEISADLVWVLRGWRQYLGEPSTNEPLVPHATLMLRGGGRQQNGEKAVVRQTEAEALRADLRAAGVNREALFVDAPNIEPLRFHDLRATFTTWAKRAGKGDGWITDRTGHQTPEMVQRYTRAARTLEDLRMDPFPDLTGKIPELAEVLGEGGGSSSGGPPPTGARGSGPMPSAGSTARTHEWTHAGLNVANRRDDTPKSTQKATFDDASRTVVVPGVAGSNPVTHPK